MKSNASYISLVVLFLAVSGCATTTRLDELYPPMEQRRSVIAAMGKPMASRTRPETGWDKSSHENYMICPIVIAFEESTTPEVRRCDVYWIPRGFMGLGVYWDYVFYDEDDRVAGHYRRFID